MESRWRGPPRVPKTPLTDQLKLLIRVQMWGEEEAPHPPQTLLAAPIFDEYGALIGGIVGRV